MAYPLHYHNHVCRSAPNKTRSPESLLATPTADLSDRAFLFSPLMKTVTLTFVHVLIAAINIAVAQQRPEPFKKANTVIVETGSPQGIAFDLVKQELRRQGYRTLYTEGNYIEASKQFKKMANYAEMTIRAEVDPQGVISLTAMLNTVPASYDRPVENKGWKGYWDELVAFGEGMTTPNNTFYAKQ